MKASIIFVGFLSILWLIDKNIVLYYFYLFTNLGTYIDQTKSLVESMPSEHLDRVYYYKLFFDYVIDSNLNFLFGYGPLVHKLNVNIRGITDLAWVFNTFLQVGLISISIYAVFYIKILNEAWKVYKINKLKYKGLFKYIIAVFLGMIVVSIPGYQAILNPVYFFMIGALVSLVYNHKIEINND
ncbi:hypothetical protein [Sulfurimonas sp. HSL3-2]|uniref:hypothetical protein n=1 Tax=Hydrocurvibacter mobilis TaxID=3131936 RepID=UPI0031F9C016